MDTAAITEVFDPGGNPNINLIMGDEGVLVVALGFEGDSKGFDHLAKGAGSR